MKTFHWKNIWLLLKDSAIAWDDDNIGQQGAALSFFTIFSLSPLLILVIVLSSFGFGQEAASGHLVAQIRGLIGIEGAQFVQSLITNVYKSHSNVLATIFSVVMFMLGASAVFVQLRDSLNTIWHVQLKPIGTIHAFLRVRLLSIALIIGIGFLLLVSLILSAVLAALSSYLRDFFVILANLVSLLNFIISFAGITVIFALMFKFVPAVILKWKDVWVGAAVTSLLFSVGKIVIGLYLGNGSIGSTFGAASSLVIFMMWTFYSSQIILFGAEFTRLYATRFGANIVPRKNATHIVIQRVEPKETSVSKE
ncbi:MAG: YihY/virulence factor BrkB family protein [Ignavibacteriales bacterium]|nr:YihY/virulence factor BrkB family protein [Ignavibacteriales bacterium]